VVITALRYHDGSVIGFTKVTQDQDRAAGDRALGSRVCR